jgi:hypothetical protein
METFPFFSRRNSESLVFGSNNSCPRIAAIFASGGTADQVAEQVRSENGMPSRAKAHTDFGQLTRP